MRLQKLLQFLLIIEAALTTVLLIFMFSSRPNFMYEIFGALLAVMITTYGLYKMRGLT
jgi:hypothetical protein